MFRRRPLGVAGAFSLGHELWSDSVTTVTDSLNVTVASLWRDRVKRIIECRVCDGC